MILVSETTRRTFLKTGSAAAAVLGLAGTRLFADPLGPPVGLQLYSVRALLPKDYVGTLKQVAAIGYREVEAAGFYGRSAAEVKQTMADVGLHCVSAHYPLAVLLKDVDGTLAYAKALGLEYVICPVPAVADQAKRSPHQDLSLDEWKWNAEQLNQLGRKFKGEGIRIGYHNHTEELHDVGGGLNGLDVLLKYTDPAYVTLEMDCGWVIAAGKDPVAYLTQHPGRFSLLHVKDLKPTAAGNGPGAHASVVLGKGTIDYKPIFAAAKKVGVKHYFVEQEDFEGDILQELAADYAYLHAMQ